MATGAGTADEVDVSARVDSKAVVLVLDVGVGDGDAGGAADIEGVSVVAAIGFVTSRIVDRDMVERKVGSGVDGKALDGRVLNVEVGDSRLLHGVGVEELGFLVDEQ